MGETTDRAEALFCHIFAGKQPDVILGTEIPRFDERWVLTAQGLSLGETEFFGFGKAEYTVFFRGRRRDGSVWVSKRVVSFPMAGNEPVEFVLRRTESR